MRKKQKEIALITAVVVRSLSDNGSLFQVFDEAYAIAISYYDQQQRDHDGKYPYEWEHNRHSDSFCDFEEHVEWFVTQLCKDDDDAEDN
jgi:hypothetical protein